MFKNILDRFTAYLMSLYLISLFSCTVSTSAQDKEFENDIISVDIVSGKIGDINYRDGIEKIKESIGEKRITASIEYGEGMPVDVYLIHIDGHLIKKYPVAVSFTDPVFKIGSLLGQGDKVKDFKKMFGEYYWVAYTEGEGVYFSSQDPRYHFCLMVDGFGEINFMELKDDEIRKRFDELVVNEITVW